jgi:large subunit ribosomal protein L1
MMPNPKLGTLTNDISEAVKKMKSGQIEYRTDKFGIMRLVVGKSDFEQNKLKENLAYVLKTIIKSKPAHIGARNMFMKTASLSTTHSPSVKLDINKLWAELV